MKSLINFVRNIHPFMLLPFMFVVTLLVFKFSITLSEEMMMLTFFIEIFSMLFSIWLLNKITQGKSLHKEKRKYVSQIGISYFGERIRWTGYFQYKFTAVFAAMYQAWYFSHFSNIDSNCGINYYVNEVGKEMY